MLRRTYEKTSRCLVLMAVLLSGTPLLAQGVAVATQAQVTQLDKRVGTLESQVRAVQRQVFPGGDKRFFAADAPPPAPEPAPVIGTPATSPLVDLTQRVEALETQQRALTGQVEQLQFQLRTLQSDVSKARGDTDFRLNALEGRASAPAGPDAIPEAGPGRAPPQTTRPPGQTAPGAAADIPVAGARPPAAKPPLAKAGTAIADPPKTDAAAAGGDPAEAAYRAAYALWQAGDDAGAIRDFQAFLKANPKHPRASHASFWQGRAMMRQGQAAQAAKAFLEGYQRYPRGERAPNSLLWLGKALTDLKRPDAACQALDELKKAYPDRLTGTLLNDSNAARAAAKCAG